MVELIHKSFGSWPHSRKLLAVVVALSVSSVASADLVVDGSLADWGPGTVADGGGSIFPVGPNFLIEDQSDTAGDGGYLGPNYGGQNYDVEFLGVMLQGDNLFLAIVTGQRPDNGFARYSPGDVYIETTSGVYGIEMGGGIGGGSGSAITEGASGATYTLTGSGYTDVFTATSAAAGSIWKDADWILDPISPKSEVQLASGTGTNVGMADYYFTRDTVTDQHSMMELSIPLSAFDFNLPTSFSVRWAPSCGNDVLMAADVTIIPAPGAVLLGCLGLATIGIVRRRFAR